MGNYGSSQVIYCSDEISNGITSPVSSGIETTYCDMSNTDIGILEFAQEE